MSDYLHILMPKFLKLLSIKSIYKIILYKIVQIIIFINAIKEGVVSRPL